MEKQEASTNENAEPAVDEPGAAPAGSLFERHFGALLAALVVVALAGGASLAYGQYDWLARTAAALPFGGETAQEEEAANAEGYGSFTELKGLVVNPAESGGARYLAVSIAFETSSPAVVEELTANEVVVRDAVLGVLSSRTVAELSNTDQRDTLREELLARANDLVSSGAIDRLYFTQFVLQ